MNAHVPSASKRVPAEENVEKGLAGGLSEEENVEEGLVGGPLSTTTAI